MVRAAGKLLSRGQAIAKVQHGMGRLGGSAPAVRTPGPDSTRSCRGVPREDVPNPAYGSDQSRWIVAHFNLPTQTRDLSVDRSIKSLVISAPRQIHQRIARVNTTWMLGHHQKNIEFSRRQRDIRSFRIEQPALLRVKRPSIEPNDFCAFTTNQLNRHWVLPT